jgi:GTP-sensing pleiotropic transcriptional regulator CodY
MNGSVSKGFAMKVITARKKVNIPTSIANVYDLIDSRALGMKYTVITVSNDRTSAMYSNEPSLPE